MSNQLFDFPEWDEIEHDRTLGPPPPYPPDTIGVPLQEQVEQVEDALSKAIDVIEALVQQEKELRDDVYQAQVDAQDWQNKYNSISAYQQVYKDGYVDTLKNHIDGYKADIGRLEGLLYDEKQKSKSLTLAFNNVMTRNQELTDENTRLELRNERQAKRLARILAVVEGKLDKVLNVE